MKKRNFGWGCGLVVAILLLAVGGCFSTCSLLANKQIDKVKQYAMVDGTVISSKLISCSDYVILDQGPVTYRYTVDKKEYKSSRYSAVEAWIGRDEMEEVITKYPAGAPCTVYYDPGNPSVSVLLQGANGAAALGLGIFKCIGFGGGGLGLLWLVWLLVPIFEKGKSSN